MLATTLQQVIYYSSLKLSSQELLSNALVFEGTEGSVGKESLVYLLMAQYNQTLPQIYSLK
jgi:hypothetical protein